MVASLDGPVPVSFGFHPYLGLPGLPRAQWRLTLPRMQKLVLDRHGIPTGEEEPFGGLDACLGERDLDDGFALLEEETSFSVAGAGRRISVELLAGYRAFWGGVRGVGNALQAAIELVASTNPFTSAGIGINKLGEGK